MSSQGANSTTLSNGYPYDPKSVRDSSDVTRAIREKITAREIDVILTNPRKNTENPWIKYGNGYRLTYRYGIYQCESCEGNAFGSNGEVS
jgi:peptide methionine sulfoxide reductase MsrB